MTEPLAMMISMVQTMDHSMDQFTHAILEETLPLTMKVIQLMLILVLPTIRLFTVTVPNQTDTLAFMLITLAVPGLRI